jgi:hypothetical protein
MGWNTKQPETETDSVPIPPEGLSTDQEAVPAPLFWGKCKIAVRWISAVQEPLALQAPNTMPGKK